MVGDPRESARSTPRTSRIRVRWPVPGVGVARVQAAAGAAWSLVFAATHVYWAAGGRMGVAGTAGAIASRPWFLAYALAAGAVFAAAAIIGFVLAGGLGSARLRRWLLALTLWGAVLALLRGFGGLLHDAVTAAMGRPLDVGVIYDAWFAVAGIVFFTAARGFRHARGVR